MKVIIKIDDVATQREDIPGWVIEGGIYLEHKGATGTIIRNQTRSKNYPTPEDAEHMKGVLRQELYTKGRAVALDLNQSLSKLKEEYPDVV